MTYDLVYVKSGAGVDMELEIISPGEIEKRSFEIIGEELERMGIALDEETAFITKRVIHTGADFDYAKNMYYSKGAVEHAFSLLKKGAHVITDTNMALAGINKKAAEKLDLKLHCFMADEDVAMEAKARNVTRAYVSMERAMKLPGEKIFAIGNAPTALVSLYEMICDKKREGQTGRSMTDKSVDGSDMEGEFPEGSGRTQDYKDIKDLVIAVPVGFVNVEASKELIIESGIPCIVARGRKGGSNVAAAIVNALMYKILY